MYEIRHFNHINLLEQLFPFLSFAIVLLVDESLEVINLEVIS